MAFLKIIFSKDEKIPKDFWNSHDKNDTPVTWRFWKFYVEQKKSLYCFIVGTIGLFIMNFGDNKETHSFLYVLLVVSVYFILVLLRKGKIFYFLYRRESYLNHYFEND